MEFKRVVTFLIHEILVTNNETYKQITLGAKAPYVLDSIDWDSATVEQSTYRVPYQIGQFLTGVQIGTRQPKITGYVISDVYAVGKSWKQYYEECEEQIEKSKLELDKIFSVYQDVMIKVGEYELTGRPTSPVKYSTKESENNDVLCYFSVTLQCFNPMFSKGEEHIEMSSISSVFKFPMLLLKNGIPFSVKTQKKSLIMENNGDVDVGLIITLKADGGTVKNPKIYNVNTGETLTFKNVTMESEDTITVNTKIGYENAIMHDVSENKNIVLIGKLDISESSFFKMKKGAYTYAYTAEQGVENLSVIFQYEEQYFNLKGM